MVFLNMMSSFFVVVFFLVALRVGKALLLFLLVARQRNGKEDEREDENTTKGKAPTKPPKCVALAFGADVLVPSSRTKSFSFVSLFRGGGFSTGRDDEKKMVKEALRETVTFWATEAECGIDGALFRHWWETHRRGEICVREIRRGVFFRWWW